MAFLYTYEKNRIIRKGTIMIENISLLICLLVIIFMYKYIEE